MNLQIATLIAVSVLGLVSHQASADSRCFITRYRFDPSSEETFSISVGGDYWAAKISPTYQSINDAVAGLKGYQKYGTCPLPDNANPYLCQISHSRKSGRTNLRMVKKNTYIDDLVSWLLLSSQDADQIKAAAELAKSVGQCNEIQDIGEREELGGPICPKQC